MSQSAGAGGAFGLLLSECGPKIKDLYDKLQQFVADSEWREKEYSDPEELPEIKDFEQQFKQAFAEQGIIIPETACLIWTGSEDDRPARCDCPAEDWVLGFGLFQRPDSYPKFDPSFAQRANWHTWVWMG